MAQVQDIAFVRTEEAPSLPAPSTYVGLNGWLLTNLVPSWWVALIAGVFALIVADVLWDFANWALLDAVFTAENREGCIAPLAEGKQLGACWAYAKAKFGQWIYGFYPVMLRWRPNLVFVMFLALMVPLMIPKVPAKGLNAALFFIVLPVLSFYILY